MYLGKENCIYLGNLDSQRLGPCKRLCLYAMAYASAKKDDYIISFDKKYSIQILFCKVVDF